MTLAAVVARLLGGDVPVRFEFYDGSALGPADASARVVVERPEALARILYAPGELGVARAYVAGDLTVEGDLRAVLRLRGGCRSPFHGRRPVGDPAGARP